MSASELKKHAKPKSLKELWDEAYKVSHVLADITEKEQRNNPQSAIPNPESVDWLWESAQELNSLALAISNQSKGIKRDEVS